MNIQLSEEEKLKIQEEAKAGHLKNLSTHVTTVQGAMEKINIKMLATAHLEASTIVHEMKKYIDFTTALSYLQSVLNWAYPAEKPVEASTIEQAEVVMPTAESPLMSIVN